MKKIEIKPLFFGSLATAFEWYDYALFGYFANIIGQQFYPSHDPVSSLLATFAVFASGFAMRPLGAILYGYIGDRVGRKYALAASMLMMAVPTTILGLLPTYEAIGIYASIGLVVVRLFQGLAVGGNYGGSFIFVIEHAPANRRGFAGSLASFGTLGGLLLGSGVATVLTKFMSPEDLRTFGWRIPFLLGSLSAVVGVMIRKHVPEKTIDTSKTTQLSPVRDVWQNYKEIVLRAIGVILLDGVGIYIIFVFMTTFATLFLNMPEEPVLFLNTVSMCSLVVLIPFFGWLGDKIGAKKILTAVAFGFLLVSYPLYSHLIEGRDLVSLAVLQFSFSILMGATYGTLPVIVAMAFPSQVRYTGAGLAFNISVACFGGTAPFIVTSLISKFDSLYVPAVVLVGVGVISLISMYGLHRSKKNF